MASARPGSTRACHSFLQCGLTRACLTRHASIVLPKTRMPSPKASSTARVEASSSYRRTRLRGGSGSRVERGPGVGHRSKNCSIKKLIHSNIKRPFSSSLFIQPLKEERERMSMAHLPGADAELSRRASAARPAREAHRQAGSSFYFGLCTQSERGTLLGAPRFRIERGARDGARIGFALWSVR